MECGASVALLVSHRAPKFREDRGARAQKSPKVAPSVEQRIGEQIDPHRDRAGRGAGSRSGEDLATVGHNDSRYSSPSTGHKPRSARDVVM